MKIKRLLEKKYNKTYDFDDYDETLEKISVDSEKSIKTVQKIVSKYTKVTDQGIRFDTSAKNETTYKDIQKQIKKTEAFSTPLIFANTDYNDYNEESDNEDTAIIETPSYRYPKENYIYKRQTSALYGPYGSQWIHDKQKDDPYTPELEAREAIVRDLMGREYHAQRSSGWFALRKRLISASDGGCVIDVNHYERPYKFILKKVLEPPFQSNESCYHGKKFERIATMIYEYRMNVRVEEFGVVEHPTINFLGASPDGIVGPYKADGISKTKYVGRMLEIKCPNRRKIQTSGAIKGFICPEYYWVQVQLQLECCNLNECDFLQCDLQEYDDRDDFIEDTDPNEPFRSISTGLEKGCLIQMLPLNKGSDVLDTDGNFSQMNYNKTVWEVADFIYPPKIEMTPAECDIWIASEIDKFNEKHPGYYFDRVVYWRLCKLGCVLIKRERDWFAEHLPTYKKMWDYVVYLRDHQDKKDIMTAYIESIKDEKESAEKNMKIMDVIARLCADPLEKGSKKERVEYTKSVAKIIAETKKNCMKKTG